MEKAAFLLLGLYGPAFIVFMLWAVATLESWGF